MVDDVYCFVVYTECLAGFGWSREDGSEVEIEDNDHFVIIASHYGLFFCVCIFSTACFPASNDLSRVPCQEGRRQPYMVCIF